MAKPKEGGIAAQIDASGPPSTRGPAQVELPKPIGVPEGYQTRTSSTLRNPFGGNDVGYSRQTEPTFYEGDDFKPARLPPEQIARIQRDLATAGVLTGKFRIGVWDDTSRSAYRSVLEYANQTGESDDAVALQKLAAMPKFDPTPAEERERAPLTVKLSNPNDLRRVLKQSAKAVLGNGNLDDATLNRLVAAYQQQEAAAQQSQYAMTDPETGMGGTITEPMDPTTFAENEVRKLDPVKADTRGAVKVASVIGRMLGGEMPSQGATL